MGTLFILLTALAIVLVIYIIIDKQTTLKTKHMRGKRIGIIGAAFARLFGGKKKDFTVQEQSSKTTFGKYNYEVIMRTRHGRYVRALSLLADDDRSAKLKAKQRHPGLKAIQAIRV